MRFLRGNGRSSFFVGVLLAGLLAGAVPVDAQVAGIWDPVGAELRNVGLPGAWRFGAFGAASIDYTLGPGGQSGLFAVQITSTPAFDGAAASVNFPPGVQIEDIGSLGYDALGPCGGGSHRASLVIDEDGDGAADGAVHVYAGTPPALDDCNPNAWESHDLLDGATRWDSLSFGGPFYGTQADAQSAAGASHQVLRVVFAYDSGWFEGQTTTVWLDKLRAGCFLLDEPPDLALSLLAGQGLCQ